MVDKKNPMEQIYLDKVTVNICVGNNKDGMDKAEKLLKKLTKKKPVKNTAKKRLAQWQIRPGLPIGFKVTLRGKEAQTFLEWMLESKQRKLKESSIDRDGNFSLGFHEYLELNGMKYDAEVGIMGFEVMATFAKPGFRIKRRFLNSKRIPKRHKVTKDETLSYLKTQKIEVI